jgi:hypothetical protein
MLRRGRQVIKWTVTPFIAGFKWTGELCGTYRRLLIGSHNADTDDCTSVQAELWDEVETNTLQLPARNSKHQGNRLLATGCESKQYESIPKFSPPEPSIEMLN